MVGRVCNEVTNHSTQQMFFSTKHFSLSPPPFFRK